MSLNNEIKRNSACMSMAGIKKIWWSNNEDVTITRTANGVNATGVWYELALEEPQMQSNDNGNGAYDTEITGTLLATSTTINRTLEWMKSRRNIAKVKDNNGIYWIVGTKEQPLRFEYSHINEGRADGKTAYELRLYATTEEPPQQAI